MANDDTTALILAALQRLEAGQANTIAHLGRIDERVGGVEVRLGGVEARLGGVEARLGGVEARLGGLETRLDRLEARMDGLEARMDRLEARMDRLEANHVQLRIDVMERIDRLQNLVTAVRDDVNVNMGRADQAHRTADNVRDELRALNDVVSGVIRQVSRLQADVRELRGDP